MAFLGYSCSIVVSYSLLVDLSTSADRDQVSSVGWAIAYIGGGTAARCRFLAKPVLSTRRHLLARRCARRASGGCCSAFRSTGGCRRVSAAAPVRRPGAAARAGFRQLAAPCATLRGFPLTLAFLVAFLIYNDGIQTVTTVAAQYGDKQLQLSDTVAAARDPARAVRRLRRRDLAGPAGRAVRRQTGRARLADRVDGLRRRRLLPAGRRGLAVLRPRHGDRARARRQPGAVAVAVLADDPAGVEAEYFCFYEISDAGTSWLGPLVFGLTYQNTGSYRGALVSLVVFFVVGFVLLLRVPVRRAVEAAGNEAPASCSHPPAWTTSAEPPPSRTFSATA